MDEIKCCHHCVPPERHLGCHGTCKRYKAEVAAARAKKEKILAKKKEDNDYSEFYFKSVQKCTRDKRRRER